MDDLLDSIKNRLKSPYFGYVLVAFVAINWRELFFLFVSDDKPQVRIDYFDAGTSNWKLFFWPLVLGGLTSVLEHWFKWGFNALSAYPSDQIALRSLKTESLLRKHRTELDNLRSEALAEEQKRRDEALAQEQQVAVDTAKQLDEVAKIEDPRAKAEAQLAIEEMRLRRTQGLDERAVNRGLERVAETHRTLSEIARTNGDTRTARIHADQASKYEKYLSELSNATNYLEISDETQAILRQVAYAENSTLVLTLNQLESFAKNAGLSSQATNKIVEELDKNGIAKINSSGKHLILDESHIEEFRRSFPPIPFDND